MKGPQVDGHDADPIPRQLAQLYEQQAGVIYRYLAGVLGNRQDAEDAFQQVWLAMANAFMQREITNPTAYLWTTARNRVRSLLADRARTRQVLDRDYDVDLVTVGTDSAAEQAFLADIARGLGQLPIPQRGAIVLICFEGLTIRQAAGRLGVAQGTMASRYRLGLERLRAFCQRDGAGS